MLQITDRRRIMLAEKGKTYSIRFVLEQSNKKHVVRWNPLGSPRWHAYTCTEEGGFIPLHCATDEFVRNVLLEHFCLSEWEVELPMKCILYSTPRELGLRRRQKEACEGCNTVELKSDELDGSIDPVLCGLYV